MLKKIVVIWWLRILWFSFLSLIIFLIISEFEKQFFIIQYEMKFFLSILIASIIIDFFRPGKYFLLFGLYPTKFTLKEIFYPVVLNLFYFILILGLIYLSYGLKLQRNSNFSINLVYYSIIIIFLWSAIEELIFRGIIFQALLEKFGFIFSSFMISLIFTLIHINNPYMNCIAFINTLLASLLLCLMFYQTKSLYPTILFHFSWNLFTTLIINSNISGYKFFDGFFNINYDNFNLIFFGGKYGVEDGILTTMYLLLLFYIVIKYFNVHPNIQSKLFKREILESK